jgi:hypothetical protein
MTFTEEAAPEALWAIAACLAANRAPWGLWLKSVPRRTIKATTRTGIVVRCMGMSLGMCSRALLRRDGVEGRPALLDVLAPAVRAEDLPLLVVDEGQNLGEEFLAIVAEEFVMGHPCLLTQGVNREILEPGTDEHNMVLAHATSRFWMVIPHPY